MKIEHSALLLCSLMGCGGTVYDHFEASLPKERQADFREFANNCQKCHSLDRALDAHVSDNHHWDLYVGRMMRTPGSGIHPQEAPGILRFLHYHTEQRNRAKGDGSHE